MADVNNYAIAYRLAFAIVKLISDSLALRLSYLPTPPEWLYILSGFSIFVALYIEVIYISIFKGISNRGQARKRSFSRQRKRLPAVLAAWLSPLIRFVIGIGVSWSSFPSFFVAAFGLACEYLTECASMEAPQDANWLVFYCREVLASMLFLTLSILGIVMEENLALLFWSRSYSA